MAIKRLYALHPPPSGTCTVTNHPLHNVQQGRQGGKWRNMQSIHCDMAVFMCRVARSSVISCTIRI